MPRKYRARYEKAMFHSGLSIINTKYIDVFHRDAKAKISLTALTQTIRAVPSYAAATKTKSIPTNATIYGAFNTQICEPVTKESLAKRKGIAELVEKSLQPPKDHINFWKTMRAKRLSAFLSPLLNDDPGPMYDVTGVPPRL